MKGAAAASPDPTSESSIAASTDQKAFIESETKGGFHHLSGLGRQQVSLSAAKGVVSLNTKVNDDWALRNLRIWMEAGKKNCAETEEKVPEDRDDAEVVCKWLCRFVQETRKENGENSPPYSIRSLCSAFQRVMQTNKLTYRFFVI